MATDNPGSCQAFMVVVTIRSTALVSIGCAAAASVTRSEVSTAIKRMDGIVLGLGCGRCIRGRENPRCRLLRKDAHLWFLASVCSPQSSQRAQRGCGGSDGLKKS